MEKVANFLIVGAAKSGTTSLFYYLNHHPDVYIPTLKECRFFSQMPRNQKGLGAEKFQNEGIRSWEEYKELFIGRQEKALGDVSNDYLYYYRISIKNIKKYLGDDVKIIIILRNPIDRAYSNYLHHVREGWEDCSFEEALEKEKERIKDGWSWPYHYVSVGMYYKQVKAYLANFNYVRVLLFEDLKKINIMMRDICNFLKIDVVPHQFAQPYLYRRYNVSGYPKNRIFYNIFIRENRLKRLLRPLVQRFLSEKIRDEIRFNLIKNNLVKKPMELETRNRLLKIYKEDILKLQNLIKRDLSKWIDD